MPQIAANTFPGQRFVQGGRPPPPPPVPTHPISGCCGGCSSARLLDSDKVYYPENGGFKLVELAPNVQHVQGGTGQQPDRRHE